MEPRTYRMMPATFTLLVFSWVFLVSGVALGAWLAATRWPASLVNGALCALGGIFLWGFMRTVANGCQILFEMKAQGWEVWNSQQKQAEAASAKANETSVRQTAEVVSAIREQADRLAGELGSQAEAIVSAGREQSAGVVTAVRTLTQDTLKALRDQTVDLSRQSKALSDRLDSALELMRGMEKRAADSRADHFNRNAAHLDEVAKRLQDNLEALERGVRESGVQQVAAISQQAADTLARLENLGSIVSESGQRQRSADEQRHGESLNRLDALQKTVSESIAQRLLDIRGDLEALGKGIGGLRFATESGAREHIDAVRDGRDSLRNALNILDDHFLALHQAIVSFEGRVSEVNSAMRAALEELRATMTQMNCDSRDVNQNIDKIKGFFDAIEHHLNLNREL